MKVSNRFLIGFAIFILAFVIIMAIIAAVSSTSSVETLPADTPEGVVQQFLLAVKEQDYEKAYQFISPPEDYYPKGDFYDNWIRSAQYARNNSSWKASIVSSTVKGTSATVEVRVDVFRPDVILRDPVSTNHIGFMLQKTEDKWKIIQPVDLWWIY